MLRKRLKEIDMRITELADYLQISRPTLYKFIDYYDTGKFDLINKDILSLFNYINENELIGKKNVINYILTKISNDKNSEYDVDTVKKVRQFLAANPESKKSMFINECLFNDFFDDIFYYIVEVKSLIMKKHLSLEEERKLCPLINFKNEIKSTEEK